MSKTDNIQASPSPYINLVSSSSKDLSPRPSLRMNTENDDCTLMHRRTPSLQYLDTPPLTLNLISNRQAGESEPCNIYREPPEFYENDFPWDGGDAFLHFDPHIGGQNQYQSTYIAGDQMVYSDESNIRQGTYTKSTETGKPRKSKTRKASPSEHSDVSSIKTKKTAVKAKGKQRMVNDDDPLLDENWEAQLKASIIQDNALHLRILRFEVCRISGECMHSNNEFFLLAYTFRGIFTEGDRQSETIWTIKIRPTFISW